MPPQDLQSPWPDRAIAFALGLVFLVLYLAFRQGTLLFNGAAFIAWFEPEAFFFSHHPVFGYFMHGWFRALEWAGLRPVLAGMLLSALAMGLCVALFYRFLRGFGVAMPIALAVAAALGWNGSSFNAATTVETYAISFLTVVLNLYAFKRAAGRPSLLADGLLFLSCLLVLAFHLGWCFWVLAIYLSLAWSERGRPWRAFGRLAEGGGAALILAAVWLAFRASQSNALMDEQKYFSTFWYGASCWGIIVKLIKNPFYDFASLAGLVLSGAGFGFFVARGRHAAWRALFVAASVIFFAYYSFWPADHGCYYLPLQPLWGLFTALELEFILRSRPRGRGLALAVMAALMAAYGVLLVLSQHGYRGGLLAVGFWGILLAQGILGYALARRRGDGDVVPAGESDTRPAPQGGAWGLGVAFLALALAVGALAYGPQVWRDHKPSPDRLRLEAFRADAPEGARLATWIEPPHLAYAITLHPAASPRPDIFFAAGENRANQEKMERWLKEAAQGIGPALYFDDYSYQMRDRIWSQSPPPSTPMDALRFEPVDWGGFRFYRAEAARR